MKFLPFLLSSMNVPSIKRISPITSVDFSDSPKRKKANTAINPGVSASKGKALLISKFFSESITQKNAPTPITDFIKSIVRFDELIVL